MKSSKMQAPIYVINLDQATDRLRIVEQQMKAEGLEFTRISGFDGRYMRPEDHPEYDAGRAGRYMGRPVLSSEIGCYKSHISALKAIAQSNSDWGIVLEDDMRFTPNAVAFLNDILSWLKNNPELHWYAVNIGNARPKVFTPLKTFSREKESYTIGRGHYFPMIAVGMIWSRDGARRFLEISEDIFAPIDNIYRHWLTRTNMGLALDHQLITMTDVPSLIDGKTSEFQRKKSPRHWHYFFSKRKRLYLGKLIALWHKYINRKA